MTPPTRAEILSATPEQLRLWCAEYIDGWEWEYVGSNAKTLLRGHDGVFNVGATVIENDIQFVMLPNYPADIGAAWLIVDKVSEQWKWYEIAWRPDGKHHANFTGNNSDSVVDSPLPVAICRAALLATQA